MLVGPQRQASRPWLSLCLCPYHLLHSASPLARSLCSSFVPITVSSQPPPLSSPPLPSPPPLLSCLACFPQTIFGFACFAATGTADCHGHIVQYVRSGFYLPSPFGMVPHGPRYHYFPRLYLSSRQGTIVTASRPTSFAVQYVLLCLNPQKVVLRLLNLSISIGPFL